MNLFRRCIATAVVALGVAGPAAATPVSTDFTDIWGNPTEAGWGLNIAQQSATLFATIFLYGTDGTPRWYVASNMQSLPAGGGQTKFGGDLYSTTGTYFATVPYNPAQFVVTPVGTMTVTFDSPTTGTLVYTVGGVTVTKNISRTPLAKNDIAGIYFGGMLTVLSNCQTSSNNGGLLNLLGPITATTTGTTNNFRLDYTLNNGAAAACNFAGTYAQVGRMGSMSGQWSCTTTGAIINSGTYQLTQIDVQKNGMTANVVATDANCTYSGTYGGIRYQ